MPVDEVKKIAYVLTDFLLVHSATGEMYCLPSLLCKAQGLTHMRACPPPHLNKSLC